MSGAAWIDAPAQAAGHGRDTAAHRAAAPASAAAAAPVAFPLPQNTAAAAADVSKTVTLVKQQQPGGAVGAARRCSLPQNVGCEAQEYRQERRCTPAA
jgi:hypothetical protein